MADAASPDERPVRARKVPREDATPQTVVERQETISSYLLRRAQRRREKFLLRSETTTMGEELLRALYLTGCVLFDFLVIPEALFLVPDWPGWLITAAGFAVAVWVEIRYYSRRFSLERDASPK